MSNKDDHSNDDNRLRKSEILRGHESFKRVLSDSISVSTEYLKSFINIPTKEKKLIDIDKGPLFTFNVKVGFVVAKKKIRKPVLRNRIKRLLRESYRLNKRNFRIYKQVNIIFSLSDGGYEHFKNNPQTKFEFINNEMKSLQKKILTKLAK